MSPSQCSPSAIHSILAQTSPLLAASTPPPGLEHMATPLQAAALASSSPAIAAALLAAFSPNQQEARPRLGSAQLDERERLPSARGAPDQPIRKLVLTQRGAAPAAETASSMRDEVAEEAASQQPQESAAGALERKSRSGPSCCMCEQTCAQDDEDASGPATTERFFIDGRFMCERCRPYFDQDGPFEPKYLVCINPLCRRKWKQLTPKALPLFCPPCKRQLEEGITGLEPCMGEAAMLELMYQRWRSVFEEIAEVANYAPPPPRRPSQRTSDKDSAILSWQETLAAFQELFPQPPKPEDVRNWNSVHGRRKHYRGTINRLNRRFVVTIDVTQELGEDLSVLRGIQPGTKLFHTLDWLEGLAEGQEVDFVAFPNPSVSEREHVSRIVRLLDVALRPEQSSLPLKDSMGSDIKAGGRKSSGAAFGMFDDNLPSGGFGDTFADLMEWSNEAQEAAEAEQAGQDMRMAASPSSPPAPHSVPGAPMPLSLATALQLDSGAYAAFPGHPAAPPGALQKPSPFPMMPPAYPGANFPRGPGPGQMPPQPLPRNGVPYPGAANQVQPPMPGYMPQALPSGSQGGAQFCAAPPRAAVPQAANPVQVRPAPFRSPFIGGPARSPMLHPRSPCAVYFGDG